MTGGGYEPTTIHKPWAYPLSSGEELVKFHGVGLRALLICDDGSKNFIDLIMALIKSKEREKFLEVEQMIVILVRVLLRSEETGEGSGSRVPKNTFPR